ncbi:MAG: phosphotransferase family protein [Actinomycetota bacterium]
MSDDPNRDPNPEPTADGPGEGATPVEMTTPWRRDLGEVGELLAAWAQARVGPDAVVTDAASPGNGMSSETVLFVMTVGGETRRYAARLAPALDVYPVFRDYDIELQARCMRVVREHTAVPAPEVCWVELDPTWLGTPFLVMGRIDGEAPPDIPPYVFEGWVLDATPAQRAALQRRTVEALVGIHSISADAVDLAFLDRDAPGATPLRRQLGAQREYYEWARDGITYPLIERTFAWLEEHFPPEGPAVCLWGDARIGNVLYRDFTPVAVLDWEMAALGPREVDVAWMIFLHTFFDDLAVRFGLPGMDDLMQRDAVVADYEELSGVRLGDLTWFAVFAALRFAIVSVRTSTRGIAYGQMEQPADPDDLIMFRGLLTRMLDGEA